ncbi:MAG: signal peptidase I [Nocardioidaceae bacterium]|nr:signal peptidase I [Nocardioidaceae bacterium]
MHRLATATNRIIGSILTLGLVAVTLACAVYLLPSLLGYERYVITGGSMTGAISKGSVAFEKNVPAADLAVGDVITYLPPADSGVTNLVTHRIVHVGPNATKLRTKGDANADVDPWTFSLTADTQPVEQFSIPYVGYGLIALADRETRMLIIGGPAALVALLSLIELGRALKGIGGHRAQDEQVATVTETRPGLARHLVRSP